MSIRKLKKAFPLNEFSILFSENVNKTLKNSDELSKLLSCYPNNDELDAIANSVGKTLKIIIHQNDENSVHAIEKKELCRILSGLTPDALKMLKRTGFKPELLNNAKLIEQKLDQNSMVFITDLMFYRMVVSGEGLSALQRYVEKNRFHQIVEKRKDQTVKRNIFQNQQDISILKLKVLIKAVCSEIKSIDIN